MARIRSLKPTFWTDEKIGLLPRDVRLTFIGLISAMADDEGRMRGNPRIVRGAVYPFDDDMSPAVVEEHLAAIAGSGRIIRYSVNGDDFIAIRHWWTHQKIDKPQPSLLPPPPADLIGDDSSEGESDEADGSTIDRRTFDDSSPSARR